MASLPLWLTSTTADKGQTVTVGLASCRNCGRVKVASEPCGFDHAAAVMAFNAARRAQPSRPA